MSTFTPWSTSAVNLGEHANNPVHTDAGGKAAGFAGAIVAGTTIYAYMTHPVVATWGTDWLANGGGELRLRRPVLDQDTVDCVDGSAAGPTIEARVDDELKATLALWPGVSPDASPWPRPGLATFPSFELDLVEPVFDYGIRAGDDLGLYATDGVAHPVIWLNLANRVFTENLVDGSWVHVRSLFQHHGLGHRGQRLKVEPRLIRRFDSRAGERAIVDINISADGQPVVSIEHEAIISVA